MQLDIILERRAPQTSSAEYAYAYFIADTAPFSILSFGMVEGDHRIILNNLSVSFRKDDAGHYDAPASISVLDNFKREALQCAGVERPVAIKHDLSVSYTDNQTCVTSTINLQANGACSLILTRPRQAVIREEESKEVLTIDRTTRSPLLLRTLVDLAHAMLYDQGHELDENGQIGPIRAVREMGRVPERRQHP